MAQRIRWTHLDKVVGLAALWRVASSARLSHLDGPLCAGRMVAARPFPPICHPPDRHFSEMRPNGIFSCFAAGRFEVFSPNVRTIQRTAAPPQTSASSRESIQIKSRGVGFCRPCRDCLWRGFDFDCPSRYQKTKDRRRTTAECQPICQFWAANDHHHESLRKRLGVYHDRRKRSVRGPLSEHPERRTV